MTPKPKTYWLTPPEVYDPLNAAYHFDFDPCPHPMPAWNGLTRSWGKSNWVNPPADGRHTLLPWVRKAIQEREEGKTSAILLPIDQMLYDLLQVGPSIIPLPPFEWMAPDGSGQRKPAPPSAVFVVHGRL